MNVVKFWIKNARDTALPQSILPSMLAVSMASLQTDFSFYLAILSVLGVIFGHLGMNLFDDYFDYRQKTSQIRDKLASEGIRARIAKCEYLTSGKATTRQLFWAASVFCLISLILGLVIFIYRGFPILYFAVITAFFGIFYSAKPIKLSYRGFGELVVGFIFGPLLMSGVYFSSCGKIDASIILIAVPVGLLVSNILFTHSIMDYEPDKKIGKMTLAVLVKNKKVMLALSFAFIFLPFVFIIYGVFASIFPLSYLLTLIILPMAISLFYLMIEFVKNPHKKFVPKFFMGPMGDWEKIKEIGIDWFMIRWFLSRNIISFFCVIIILINLVKKYV